MAPMPDDAPVMTAVPLCSELLMILSSCRSRFVRGSPLCCLDCIAWPWPQCHINGDLGHRAPAMRRITFLVYPGYSVMALATVSVFETANLLQRERLSEVAFIS